jgi:hypothetical protein
MTKARGPRSVTGRNGRIVAAGCGRPGTGTFAPWWRTGYHDLIQGCSSAMRLQ